MARSPNADRRTVGLVTLCIMSIVVGAVTGLGAIALRALIGLIHNFAFLGTYSWYYDANEHTPPSVWGPWIILAPVIGGLIVVFLVRQFAPEARGHGVPEVMDAIYYKGGRIRAVVVVIKSLASALSIGSGASVGREGPIIQIGSGIGSTLGQLWRLPTWQTVTLVAAGAGAGIAATFNTPLGGVMFAIELMLPELSARTFLPVVLATGTATYIGRIFFGVEPAFLAPSHVLSNMLVPTSAEFLPIYVVLGLLCGLASALFVWFLHFMEDLFDEMPGNDYTRNVVGMTLLGGLFYGIFVLFGHYHVEGVGYATIQQVLSGEMNTAWLLLLLCFAKLLATCLSLGSGSSGGIFSPSLFIGATLGGWFGVLSGEMWPNLGLGPVPFAIIGMAGMVGGGTGAAMTAILMIFEMTRDYAITVPAIIAVASAIGLRRVIMRENIYTMKLARRGHFIPRERHSHMFLIRHTKDVMVPVNGVIAIEDLATHRPETGVATGPSGFRVVAKGRRIAGIVPESDQWQGALFTHYIVVRDDDFLQQVMQRMGKRTRKVALVVHGRGVPRPERVIGVITRREIGEAIMSDFVR